MVRGKLFIGILANPKTDFEELENALQQAFGSIDFESETMEWNFSRYYEPEMGKNLLRKFFGFERQIAVEELAGIKLQTGKIEDAYRIQGKRTVNLDPGILTNSMVLLASLKPAANKILLGKEVYGHMVLQWNGNTFIPLPRCFPDYRTEPYLALFASMMQLIEQKGKVFKLSR